MKALHIQLQPELSPELDVTAAITLLRLVGELAGTRPQVTEGFDNGRFINLEFAPEDTAGLWASVREELSKVPGLADAAIVCVQGERGWDDYLLLHHFDKAVPRDQFDDDSGSALAEEIE
jgi:hypothetical protein